MRIHGQVSRLVFDARLLQTGRPLATGPAVTMFQVLAEVVGAVELLGLVAFAVFVHLVQVLRAFIPVGWVVGKLFTAVPAQIKGRLRRLRLAHVVGRWKHVGGEEEGGIVAGGQGGTGPRVTAQVQGVLMPFGFILVLESIVAILTSVLLLGFVLPEIMSALSARLR